MLRTAAVAALVPFALAALPSASPHPVTGLGPKREAVIPAPRDGGAIPVCETYITITQAPPDPYYQTTANITVAWGEFITEWPTCISMGGPDAATFSFTVNGVDRTAYFDVTWDGATGSGVPLVNGVLNTLTATIQGNDANGNPRTDTDTKTTFVNSSAQPMAPVVDVASVNPGPVVERDLCLSIAVVADAASECGDLRVVHSMPTVRTLGRIRAPTLIYNSDHAYPWPLVAANATLPANATVPDSVVAVLTVGGLVRARGKWAGNQWSAGQARRIVVGFGAVNDATGVYSYTLEVTNFYDTTGYAPSTPSTGQFIIVDRSTSPFGAGWWLAGLEQLNPATKLWVGGDGGARIYQFVRTVGADSVWAAPSVDRPDTLKWRADSLLYVRFLPHGVQVRFNSSGQHVATVDGLGHQTRFSYSSGLLQYLTLPPDAVGFSYQFSYTGGKLYRIDSPGLRVTNVTMNAGRVSSILDPDGRSVSFGFDPVLGNRIRTRTDRRGTVTTFESDQEGRKLTQSEVAMVSSANILTRYGPAELKGLPGYGAWDTAQAYTKLVGPRADADDDTYFWLDRLGAPRKIQNAVGSVTLLQRTDGLWPAAVTRLVRYVGADSQVLRATYDVLGMPSTVTDSSLCQSGTCATTRYEYDPLWAFVTKIVRPMGDSIVLAYDPANGNRLWQQDARGPSSRVSFFYNNGFRLLSHIQTPLVTVADSLEYNVRGNLSVRRTAVGLAFGFATTYQDDGMGLPASLTSPTGITTSTYYDTMGFRETLVSTSGPARSITGDLPWSPLSWAAATASVQKIYDDEGNLIETRRSSSTGSIGMILERTRYDRANRPVARIAADGLKDSVLYDEAGNAIRLVTRRLSQQPIQQDFDPANRLTQRRTPTVTYADTTFQGVLFPAKTIAGDTIRFYYDALGRDTLAVNRFARTRRAYGRSGLLASDEQRIRSWTARANSTWSTAGFDQHVYTLGYAYDLDGRRTVLAHPAQLGPATDTTRFGYYRFGADSSVTDPYGGVFRFFYDAEGRPDSLAYPNNTGERRQYYADGALHYRTVRSGASPSYFPNNVIRADTIAYDFDGRVGWVKNADRELFTFDYTGLGQVGRSIEAYWSSLYGWVWSRREYFWPDALGNTLKRSIVTGPSDAPRDSFEYSAGIGRLTRQADLWNGSWAWQPATSDPAGNQRFTSRYQLGAQCVDGDAVVCFDMQTVRYQGVAGYWYDADQRMVASKRNAALQYPNSDQAGGQEEYWYDAYGRRILRYWVSNGYWDFGYPWQDFHLNRYVWDGAQILYEIRTEASTTNIDNDLLATDEYGRVGYVHGPGIDSPLEAFRADGYVLFPRLFLHPNWRGTITLGSLSDGTQDRLPNQMVDWRRQNTSTYGERQSVFTNVNHRFFGSLLSRQADGSRLQYLRNRYYDPNTGRFTQEDPIGLAGGLNLYGFANGDPVNFSDPFGLCIPDCLMDLAFVGADIGDIARNGLSWGRGLALGADVLAAAIPLVPAGAGLLARGGARMARVRALGRAGETGAGIARNAERIASISRTARYRVPDGLSHARGMIQEVKNVAYQAYTAQLRDLAAYARQEGYTFELFVREGNGTRLSRELQQAVDGGEIILRRELK